MAENNLYNDSAELEGHAAEAVGRALELPNVGQISQEQRNRLEALLGAEGKAELSDRDQGVVERREHINSSARLRILYKILQSRGNLMGVVEDLQKIDPNMLISGFGPSYQKLNQLVRDASSPHARALAFYYEYMRSLGMNKSDAFAYIADNAEYQKLQRLKKIRTMHDELIADDENFLIGGDAQNIGGTIYPRSHKMKTVMDKIDQLQASLGPASTDADRARVKGEVDQENKKLDALKDRKNKLLKGIGQLNAQLAFFGMSLPEPELAARNFGKDAIRNHRSLKAAVPVQVHMGNHTDQLKHASGSPLKMSHLLADDRDRKTLDSLMNRYRSNPNSPPLASDVLREVVNHSVAEMTDIDKEEAAKEIQRLLTTTGDPNVVAPSATSAATSTTPVASPAGAPAVPAASSSVRSVAPAVAAATAALATTAMTTPQSEGFFKKIGNFVEETVGIKDARLGNPFSWPAYGIQKTWWFAKKAVLPVKLAGNFAKAGVKDAVGMRKASPWKPWTWPSYGVKKTGGFLGGLLKRFWKWGTKVEPNSGFISWGK
jgi:hypothetical protein